MTLNPQAQRILDILSDGCWHCAIDWNYSDGHAKRITDISRFIAPTRKIISDWCDCGRHTAKVKKRKLVDLTPVIQTSSMTSQQFFEKFPLGTKVTAKGLW